MRVLFAATAVFFMSLATTAQDVFGDNGAGRFRLSPFRATSFGGGSTTIGAGERILQLGRGQDDEVSSAKAGPGCRLTIFENINLGGDRREISGDVAYLGDLWNDKTASAECRCENRVDRFCRVFADTDFKGRSKVLPENTVQVRMESGWNDKISSVKVDAKCHLQVFQDKNFKGDSRTFDPGQANVGALWNDKISSLNACASPSDGGRRAHGRTSLSLRRTMPYCAAATLLSSAHCAGTIREV